jgi:hypothetical protein
MYCFLDLVIPQILTEQLTRVRRGWERRGTWHSAFICICGLIFLCYEYKICLLRGPGAVFQWDWRQKCECKNLRLLTQGVVPAVATRTCWIPFAEARRNHYRFSQQTAVSTLIGKIAKTWLPLPRPLTHSFNKDFVNSCSLKGTGGCDISLQLTRGQIVIR